MAACPSCGSSFDVESINGVSVAKCGACDGVWLAAGDLDRLTGQELEAQLGAWLREPKECRYCQAPLGDSATCVRCQKSPTIECARGHGVMEATIIELGPRDFEIDRCSTCQGLWIDGHERDHLDVVDLPPAHKFAMSQTDRLSRSAHVTGRTNSFLAALNEDLSVVSGGTRLYGGMLRGGRSEPLGLILVAIVVGSIVAALYHFTGASLF